ncbi:MAG: carbohydrate kinase [Erysipelotrichaceae bacterium]|nr:carbohydrate kinase [Erysipelotrichaceae bacterium]MDY5252383.1 carbohydrate kinase [Erysipelotrichaceae bacterium]
MKKALCVIGEALIDFIPQQNNCKLKDVVSFEKAAGGAPANVAGAVAKLGGQAKILTQLGKDAFGDYLLACMQAQNIDTAYVKQHADYDTSLAFVSLDSEGNRDFKFYRKTAADLAYGPDDVDERCLDDVKIVHFCSVDLVPSPMRQAHVKLLELAMQKNIWISFDPNLRFSLWPDKASLKQTVWEFMKYAHIVKIADEELNFICDSDDINVAKDQILKGNCQMLIYTKGSQGSEIFTREFHIAQPAYKVKAIDTTGAGDTFIGAFLYRLLEDQPKDLTTITKEDLQSYLSFASVYAAYMTTVKGALASLADHKTIAEFTK